MKMLIALMIVLLMVVPVALAQTGGQESPGGTPTSAAPVAINGQALKLDAPLTVHLNGTTPVNLSYKSSGNETISVTARSLEAEDVLDPTLSVLDPGGATLASNDDHRTSRTDLAPRDSLIAGLTLNDPGHYVVQVAGVDASAQGNVEVLVTSGGAAATPQASNETLDDRVPDGSAYTHNIQANAGEVITISVRETDNKLDPTVTLLDSSGSQIATNDDQTTDPSLGPYDSQIANFTIPATGTYTIQITGYEGVGGAFELTIDRGGTSGENPTPEPTLPTEVPTQTTQVIQGTVKSNDVYTYKFQANAGDVYTITVQAVTKDLDPRVSLYLNNNYVMDNDDYGSTDPSMQSTDARIYDQIMTESGTYEIDVRGYQDTSGDFTMTIERVATGAPTGLPTEHVELGSVKSGETYSYSFDAQAGDWVTITARVLTQNFDAYITLMSADGTVLIDNDNNGTSYGDFAYYDARIPNYHITTSGKYTVEVSGVSGTGGSFGLTIGTLR